MASYNADINVNVNVFDKKLRDLERRIQALDKIANPKKPLTRTQAAVELKAAKEELEVTKAIQSLIERKQQAHNKLKQEYAQQVRLRKEELSYEERSLRLANARKLQESRLTSLERAGAFEGKGRSAEISGLLRKRDQFSQNPAIQERVATALGRILTLQNAINRAETKNIGQKQRIADYNKRIEALRSIGVTEGQLRQAIRRRAEFTDAADKRQDTIANKRELQLKRELALLEEKNRLLLKPTRQIASPIRGATTLPGSPRFLEAQASDQLKLEKALLDLKKRGVSALNDQLKVRLNIVNATSRQAQLQKDAQLQGQSLRIPTPYRTAGSMGFPVALPEIAQDRRIRAREEAKQSAERALNLQKSNSLLTQGVTGLKAQVAIAEQLGGVYAEIVRSLERANDRQSQLFRARANRAQRQEPVSYTHLTLPTKRIV